MLFWPDIESWFQEIPGSILGLTGQLNSQQPQCPTHAVMMLGLVIWWSASGQRLFPPGAALLHLPITHLDACTTFWFSPGKFLHILPQHLKGSLVVDHWGSLEQQTVHLSQPSMDTHLHRCPLDQQALKLPLKQTAIVFTVTSLCLEPSTWTISQVSQLEVCFACTGLLPQIFLFLMPHKRFLWGASGPSSVVSFYSAAPVCKDPNRCLLAQFCLSIP